MNTYQFHHWNFTDKEINQIVTLVKAWSNGGIMPIDCRKYTRNVIAYATGMQLLRTGNASNGENEKRLYLTGSAHFSPRHDMPVESLWRIVKEIMGERRGYSVSCQKGWLDLNIWPNGHQFHTNRDYTEIVAILNELCLHHYIIFQYGGSIWSIYVENQ